ncbi:hypothetical protein D1872_292820 [compost metagenome]
MAIVAENAWIGTITLQRIAAIRARIRLRRLHHRTVLPLRVTLVPTTWQQADSVQVVKCHRVDLAATDKVVRVVLAVDREEIPVAACSALAKKDLCGCSNLPCQVKPAGCFHSH